LFRFDNVTMFIQPKYFFVKLAKFEAHYGIDIFWLPWPPPGYAHGGGIATSSLYKYTMVLYLNI